MASSTPFRPTWFCRDELEHQRFVDMHARLLNVNARLLLLLAIAMLPALLVGRHLGAAAPAVAGIALFGVLQRLATRLPRPEVITFIGLLGAITMIVVAAYLYEATATPGIAVVIWPITGTAGRYPRRVLVVAVAYTCVICATAQLLADPSILRTDPISMTMLLAGIIAAASMSAVLRDSDIDSRGAAILDPLTGMLNRHALNTRIPEIEEQSQITERPVGVIVADLDHFKSVNDQHGHNMGDAVLRDVAYVLRRELRAYDLAYRMGGEEFVVLLPGAGIKETAEMAERLRAAVHAEPIQGLEIEISAGAACTRPGEVFDWKSLFERADAALYEAKRGGRNRVVVCSDEYAAAPACA